jgi:hypothetical protein
MRDSQMKAKTIIYSAFLILFVTVSVNAQESTYRIPLNIKKAVEKGTRTLDGTPGPNYWQNTADYTIKAEVEPATRTVSGKEIIVYSNNSQDTLKQVVVKILMDLYKKSNPHDFEISPVDLTDGAVISKIVLNNEEIKIGRDENSVKCDGTNLFIPVQKGIAPKAKVELKIDWNFILPKETKVRMGAYDETSFFVAYWYPQVAVYDDIDGWDVLNYTGQVETYNDFSNYNVEVTVPKNFLVWATGLLQNPEEVYSAPVLERYKEALNSNTVKKIVEEKDYKNGPVTADKDKITYRYKAENVMDFVFATSDHYLWDGSSIVVDAKTGRQTFIDAAYNKSSKDYYEVAQIAQDVISYFSTQIPGRPFPYPKMTVFNGQGGMEYPMMVNNSSVEEHAGTIHLTAHEICHTYFPFYMGINERKYAWMDEGWATMLPFEFETMRALGYDPRSLNARDYSQSAGTEQDIPPIVLSNQLRGQSYRSASYRRPGLAYGFLKEFLGDDMFLKCLHEYMDKWNGKHPVPYDFFNIFSKAAGQNLDWYFKPWYIETKYPDLSLSAKLVNGSVNINVTNKGGLPLPVKIKFYNEDGTRDVVYQKKADEWKDGKTFMETTIHPAKKVVRVELGTSQIPDVNLKDNVVEFK